MIELSGREIVGAAKITDRQAQEFKKLVASVDACGNEQVILNLTDLDATALCKKDSFYEFIHRHNLTVVVDAETADSIQTYARLTNVQINYIVKEAEIIPEKEEPEVKEKGEKYATKSKYFQEYVSENGEKVRNCLVLKITDLCLDTISSIGNTGPGVRKAIEILAEKAFYASQKLVVDVTDVVFEAGCDRVLAEALVDVKSTYNRIGKADGTNRKLGVAVLGDGSGISEFVNVYGRVKLSAKVKARFFDMLKPNTVCRLNAYPSTARSDIAGRKGFGKVSGAVIVIYRGLDGTDAVYDEIPTHQLYLLEDLQLLGEVDQMGDKRIPRRRNIEELGITGVCSGSHGHFGPVDKREKFTVNDGYGNLIDIPEQEFVARGLDALGFEFDRERLSAGRLIL